jgi:hypothetical protein
MSDNPKLQTPLGRLELMPDAVQFRGITSFYVIPYSDITAVRTARLPTQKLSIETDAQAFKFGGGVWRGLGSFVRELNFRRVQAKIASQRQKLSLQDANADYETTGQAGETGDRA